MRGPVRVTIGRARRSTVATIAAVTALFVGALVLADASPVSAGAPTATLVFVAGSDEPSNGDKPVVELAEDLGFDVIVIDDDTPNLADIAESFTPAVIVVSSTVTPATIGDAFTESTRPVLTWEPYLFDDLGLTQDGGASRGEVSAGTAIKILDSTHPITAPLSGFIAVTASPQPMTFGVPVGDVQALATVAGSSRKAGIMVAESGDRLADGVAAGVRVAMFMSWASPPVLTDDGRTLLGKALSWAGGFMPPAPNVPPVVDAGPDQTITLPTDTAVLDATVTDDSLQLPTPTVEWTAPAGVTFADSNAVDTMATFAESGTYTLTLTADDGSFQTADSLQVTVRDPAAPAGTRVLFVVGNAMSPAANDMTIESKLVAAGLDVTRVDDDDLPADIAGVHGIVISTSIAPDKVGTTFTDADVPILVYEGYLLDELGLSDGPNGETPNPRTTINITDPTHPLAAGLAGYTSVLTSPHRMTYATPGPGAYVVAFDGSPNANRAVLFAYLTDAPLPGGGNAPARRVVVFPDFGGTGVLTGFGMDIMIAAIAFFLVPDNEPPVVDDQTFSVDENSRNGTAVGSISFSDPDLPAGDVVTFAVTGGTGSTAFDVGSSGDITVADVAQLNFETTPSFTLDVVATDSAGETDTATITIDLIDVNDAPLAVDDRYGVPSSWTGGSATSIVANDSDADGDALTIIATSVGPLDTPSPATSAGGRPATITISDSEPQYQLAFGENFRDLGVGDNDTITITYTISDPGGLTDTADVFVTIHGVNDPPVATDDDFDVGEGEPLSEDVLSNDTDPDANDTLTITGANGNDPNTPFGVTSTDGRTGTASVAPDGALNLTFDQDGNFEDLAEGETDTVVIDYDITDGNGGADTGRVTITIQGANDAPDAVDDAYTIDEDGSVSEDPRSNDSDIDGDALTVQSVAHAGGAGTVDGTPFDVTSAGGRTAVVSATATTFDLSPDGNFDDLGVGDSDSVTLTYVVADPGGLTDTATITVTIDGTNNPPVAADFGVTAIGNTQLRSGTGETAPISPPAKLVANNLVTASTNAVAATAASAQATALGGSVDINTDGSFVYTPPTGVTGEDSFGYEVLSAEGATASGTVTVTVDRMVWYVSPSGNSGNSGRSHDPFGAEQVDRAGTGDTIYFSANAGIYDTDGTNPGTGQSWIGSGVALIIDGTVLVAASSKPTLSQLSAIRDADVTLSGMTVAGIFVSGGLADRFTTSDIDVTRYFQMENTVDVSVDIDAFNDTGGGRVYITNVTGTTTFDSFNATTAGSASPQPAYLSLDNAGTVTINGAANTIDAPATGAVSILNTTIAGSGTGSAMAFQSATGSSIVMNDVTGGFQVTGTTADASCGGSSTGTCSGGTVSSVSLNAVGDVSLHKLKVLDSAGDAVTVTSSSNVTIADSEIIGAGDANDEDGVVLSQVGGSFALIDSLVTGFHDTGVRASNTSGSATIDIIGNHFANNHEILNGGNGENALDIRALGTATLNVNVTDNSFDDVEGSSVKIVNESSSGFIDANIVGNTITNQGGADDFPTFPAIDLIDDNLGTMTFDVQGNIITDNPGSGIAVSGNGTLTGTIGGPTLADRNIVARSALGDGIELDVSGDAPGENFDAVIRIQNNDLDDLGDDGIQILHRDNNGTLQLEIIDNLISTTASEAIRFFSDHDLSGGVGDPFTNLRIAGNAFSSVAANTPIIFVRSRDTASVCASITANTGFDGSPINEIDLLVDPTAQLRLHQASAAALASENAGAAVLADAGVDFAGLCSMPTPPTNP